MHAISWEIVLRQQRARFVSGFGQFFSNSLIIHEAKTKENKRDGFGNMIKHLHKLAKLSPSSSPEVRICLRSCIEHSH